MLLYQFQSCNLPCDFFAVLNRKDEGKKFAKRHIGFNFRVRWEEEFVTNQFDSKAWTLFHLKNPQAVIKKTVRDRQMFSS